MMSSWNEMLEIPSREKLCPPSAFERWIVGVPIIGAEAKRHRTVAKILSMRTFDAFKCKWKGIEHKEGFIRVLEEIRLWGGFRSFYFFPGDNIWSVIKDEYVQDVFCGLKSRLLRLPFVNSDFFYDIPTDVQTIIDVIWYYKENSCYAS